jgi:hypothetical protein
MAGVEMQVSPECNLMILRRSRHRPAPGDVFVANALGKRWIAGRVIVVDSTAKGGNSDDGILLYVYKQEFASPADIKTPLKPELLFAPIVVSRSSWTEGYFVHLFNAPLQPEELLARHVFRKSSSSKQNPQFQDEYRREVDPPKPGEWCGRSGLSFGIDYEVSHALGLPYPPPQWKPKE